MNIPIAYSYCKPLVSDVLNFDNVHAQFLDKQLATFMKFYCKYNMQIIVKPKTSTYTCFFLFFFKCHEGGVLKNGKVLVGQHDNYLEFQPCIN